MPVVGFGIVVHIGTIVRVLQLLGGLSELETPTLCLSESMAWCGKGFSLLHTKTHRQLYLSVECILRQEVEIICILKAKQ